jgi:hypothetical protein
MQTIELQVPALHSGQRRIQEEATRFNAICCGRRFGKSVLSRRRLLRSALAGKPAAYFAPTYKMLSDYWRESIAELFPVLDKSNVQEKRLQFIGGGSIDMWSLDEPNAARGRKYAHVAIDEAASVARLQEAWQEVLRPTLADYQGTADFYSTPKGRNFFWQLWQRGQDTAYPEWQSWQMPTSTNPHINKAEIEAARLELPERVFEQEFLAQFLEDGGGVFRGVLDCAVAPRVAPYRGEFVMGVDWGQQNDFTALTVLDARTHMMVDFDRFNQIGWHVQRERLKKMADKWKVGSILAEHNSIGGPNIEALQRERLPVRAFTTTSQSKAEIIEGLQLAFERRAVGIFNDPVLTGELQAYEMTRTSSGLPKFGAPAGMHDDCVMSLALALWAITGVKSRRLVSF